MTEATHTPGPWFIATGCSWRRVMAQSHMVCEPITQSDGHPDLYFPNGGADGPDARLIASAPDLLAALARIAELDPATDSEEGFNEWGEADCFGQAKKIARAAIAAATGAAAMKEPT